MNALILLFILAVISGTIVMQIYLSMKENKWPGLILPLFTLALSLIVFFRALVFTAVPNTSAQVSGPSLETTTDYVRAAFLFLYCNVPTTLLLTIYAACGGKRRRLREINRLSAYDYDYDYDYK